MSTVVITDCELDRDEEMIDTTSGPGGRVRLGFTGVGKRGEDLLEDCLEMDDVEISAVCDVQQRRLETVSETIVNDGRDAPSTYTDHAEMLVEADLNGVIIAPSWRYHVPMAI